MDSIKIKSTGPPRTKVPGLLPKIDSGKETHINSLDKYTVAELEELRDRQKHLLANKSRLKCLPDKGERVRALYERILKELEHRNEVNQASELFSELNIASKGKSTIVNMEWHGKLDVPNNDDAQERIVSNAGENELNLIKLLAQTRQTEKIVQTEQPEPTTLITAADLEEIKSFETDKQQPQSQQQHPPDEKETKYEKSSEPQSSSILEPHARYMCDINTRHAKEVHKERYLPHKTTISNVHSVTVEKSRKPDGKNWEITAATPPRLRNSEVVTLSLQESINIQRQQIDALKEIERKHAEERLAFRNQLANKIMIETHTTIDNPSAFFKTYREVQKHPGEDDEDDTDSDDELDSENEVHDLYDEPLSGGGVNVIVYDK